MIEKTRVAFLVGMPRAATTFLYHNLNLHPNLYIPFRRKSNYFSLHYEKGEKWFLSHFDDAPPTSVAIDTETLAFVNRHLTSPHRIKEFNKDAKVILCVRDPASWAVSLYDQIATFDSNISSFDGFLNGEYTLVEDGVGTKFHMRDGDVLARVREYQALFPESILLLKFTEVTNDPLGALKKIEEFLNVPAHYDAGNIITKKINAGGRRHNKFLNLLLRNEVVISVISMLPRRLVLAARWIFDGLVSGGEGKGARAEEISRRERMFAIAKQHYRSDIEALEKLC